jgi:hypothetical protein
LRIPLHRKQTLIEGLPMSALGHKRTNHRGPKSAVVRFGPKADMAASSRDIHFTRKSGHAV